MSTIEKLGGFRFRSKVAAFDFDWTLCRPASGATFPKDVADWTWLRPNVPDVVRDTYARGYCIVVFTNQTKAWKRDQIVAALLVQGKRTQRINHAVK